MKTFNEYIAETTAPIIMDVVRMQKYEKRIRSARIEKRKRTMRSDKSITMQSCQKSEKQFEMIAASDGSYFLKTFLEKYLLFAAK